ncbi:asparagine synthase-related protein [Paenibacillus sp. FSL H8-0034]|uniref:asparagine synthase-related protein n=1 Tax=Paenibacillus sp. FSL H8-0034 TaxID=2954671 RepID=UPI0030FAB805
MSAIAGLINFNEDIDIEQGDKLMRALQKYPSDSVDTWHTERVFFGCHAQWITPESISERLPYYDSERKLAITADAIIDNRTELFDMLAVEHGQRKTMSDSQLILLAYRKWEQETPKYLIGDFTFMICDDSKHILFGARDFSGNRTLYYHQSPKRFAFCTIMEPLFTLPQIEKKLNEQWLAEFLAIPLTVDAMDCSSTVYAHIEQIPPSHTITVKDGKVTFSRYSTLKAGDMLKLKSNGEYEEAFRDVFQQAVSARLRTHRQVGAHLSGGLDSGSVASFAAKALRNENKRLHTFSYVPVDDFTDDWTPRDRFSDERPYIQSTVAHVGNINSNYLDLPGMSPLSEINDWLEMMEMPYKFFENSFWLKGIYENAHHQGVGVLLNGQRGNWTISWGPALDYQAMLMRKLRWIQLYREMKQFGIRMGVGRKRILSVIGKKAFPAIGKMFTSNTEESFPMLINPQFAKRTNVLDKLHVHGFDRTDYSLLSAYDIRKQQFEQLYSWNLNGTIGTKLSLRYSLWERDPTNDLRVIRFCLSVPDNQFVQNGLDRALIRRATADYLPDNVRLNQKKRGVQGADGVHRMAPSWKAFINEIQQLIQDPSISQYLNIEEIKSALFKIKEAPRPEYVYEFGFRILMRSLIFYRFIKGVT